LGEDKMAEPIRVGINGFGVMGRYLLRALQKDVSSGKLAPGMVEVVAVNDMYPVSQLFPLLEHDSTYLGFPGKLETDGKDILVDGKRISMSAEKDTKQLHWADRGVDIVYESTGVFVEKPGVEGHFESGAKKVIFSAPSGLAEMTIVMGVNDKSYSGQRLVSNASCTTNCLAPLAQAFYDSFGVYTGLMTTIHAYTADQRLVDSPHKDTARAYAAALNFLPTSTGAAKAIGKVISELDGKLKGMCIRGPVPVGSIVDLVVNLSREVSPAEVNEAIQKIGRQFGIKTSVLIGGAPIRHQIREISFNPHIIIGTPGRINDHIQQRTLNLQNVSILILDEADRMFDMGFAPQINKILLSVPKNRQTMLFSATMPEGIVKIATHHMKLPIRVEVARSGTTAKDIEQELFVVKKDQKLSLLKKILQDCKGSVLIFIRVKHNARKICNNLRDIGISAAEIHSNRSLNQRKEALEGFKLGRYRVLVATDIASRGIDVKNIELVINYDLPENAEDYVHRIGRTGRAGMSGKAISFAMPEQGHLVRDIEMLTRINLPISQLPSNLPQSAQSPVYNRRSNFRYARKRY